MWPLVSVFCRTQETGQRCASGVSSPFLHTALNSPPWWGFKSPLTVARMLCQLGQLQMDFLSTELQVFPLPPPNLPTIPFAFTSNWKNGGGRYG